MRRTGISIFRTVAFGLALLTAWTSVGVPQVQAMMAPTEAASVAVASDRESDLRVVRASLENKVVRQRLADMGLSPEQIDGRLSRLDDGKLHQVAMQIEKQNPAGDAVVGILVIAILVVLLVYLLQRV